MRLPPRHCWNKFNNSFLKVTNRCLTPCIRINTSQGTPKRAWIEKTRRTQVVEKRAEPYLTDDMKIDLATKYFPRYPTKRAVLLPALHAVQHKYGWIPTQALEEVGAFLELPPAEVLDTATFYEEYWLRSEEHTSELQSPCNLVCRLLLEKKKNENT